MIERILPDELLSTFVLGLTETGNPVSKKKAAKLAGKMMDTTEQIALCQQSLGELVTLVSIADEPQKLSPTLAAEIGILQKLLGELIQASNTAAMNLTYHATQGDA